jgi:hypothetical protein
MKSPMSPRAADVDLAGRQEHRHADVDQQAALDLAHDRALDDVAFLGGVDDALPAADAVGLALGELDQAAVALERLEQHVDLVADTSSLRFELFAGDQALALEAHINDDIVTGEADD